MKGPSVGLKIAIFTTEFPPYPGGIATYAAEFAAALVRLGHYPVVFAPDYDNSTFEAPFEVVRCFPRTYSHGRLPLYAAIAARQLAKARYDLLIAGDLATVLALSCLPTSARKIAIVHGTDVKSRILRYINAISPRSPFNFFETVYANSEFTKNTMLKYNPKVRPDRISVAPLGVGAFWKEHQAPDAVEQLVAPFAFDAGKTLALSVARLEPRKGFFQALDAIARLPDHIRDNLTYAIAGRPVEQDYAEDLKRKAAGMDADIRILGEVSREQIRALYKSADIFIHAATKNMYRAEGFGLVLLEAAASGLPSLATRVDAIPEVVVENVSGLLYDDGDVAGISDGITALVEDAELRRKLSEGCEAVVSRYTWDRCAEIVLNGSRTAIGERAA